jgi:hypothetical protein
LRHHAVDACLEIDDKTKAVYSPFLGRWKWFSVSLNINRRRSAVARKTVLVSDQSGREIPEGKGAKVRITFNDARKGARELDLLDEEAEALGGRSVARRGRRPKSAS